MLPLAAHGADLALISAAERGDHATVRRLLDAGAAMNMRDARRRNAVLAATQGGHVEAARLLIARGADVNAQVVHAGSDDATGRVRAGVRCDAQASKTI